MELSYGFNHSYKIIEFIQNEFEEFKEDLSIHVVFSDVVPPIFNGESEFRGKFFEGNLPECPFEELMGHYSEETQKITIYLQGIGRVVNELLPELKVFSKEKLYELLIQLVLLHEIGHWWFYHTLSAGNNTDQNYDAAVHEWIAQSFAFICIQHNEEWCYIMDKLSRKQPAIYQNYKSTCLKNTIEFKRVVDTIRNLPPQDRNMEELTKIKLYRVLCRISTYRMLD